MRPSTSPKNQTPTADGKILALAHLVSTFLLAVAFVFALVKFFAPANSGWSEAILILLTTISTLLALARQLPMQNVLLAAFVIALIGGAAHTLGARTGIPFGPFIFSAELKPQLFETLPWAIPAIWVVVLLNSRGVARLILRPWRKTKTYGFWLIGFTAVLTMFFDLALDPFASRVKHFWFWTPTKFPLTWQGAPLVNFLGWAFLTVLILAFVTPALINKQLSKRRPPDFQPLAIWLGAILISGIACAQNGLWAAVAVDSAIGIVTAIFAVRGAKW